MPNGLETESRADPEGRLDTTAGDRGRDHHPERKENNKGSPSAASQGVTGTHLLFHSLVRRPDYRSGRSPRVANMD